MALAKFYEDLIEERYNHLGSKISKSKEKSIPKIVLSDAIKELETLKKVIIDEVLETINNNKSDLRSDISIQELRNTIRVLKREKEILESEKQFILNKCYNQHKDIVQNKNKIKELTLSNESKRKKIKSLIKKVERLIKD